MANHDARFPGKINDLDSEALSERQAGRLAAISRLPIAELKNKTLGELRKANIPRLDLSWLLHRRICGQVVKTDAAGVDHPVPFATVKVYDTDIGLIGWSPSSLPYTWFSPLYVRRELLRTVTTDECGRFCVSVPRWEIDYYLRWRAERRCYLTWLRWPNVQDVLVANSVIPVPHPDPGPLHPLHIDEHVLGHASRVLDAPLVNRLRAIAPSTIGDAVAKVTNVLAAPAFMPGVRPPLDAAAKAQLATKNLAKFASRLSVKPELLKHLNTEKFYGPFLRCRTVIVPEWTAVLDIPDITFEVLQDVNGDGTQEVIYHEGLFDVRWDAASIPDVKLHASAIAVTSPLCDGPPGGIPAGPPGILFAGNYPLKQSGQPSTYQDDLGFGILCNRPDSDGIPTTPNRYSPANAPFTGSFFLMGDAEAPGATHYRISHQVGGGAAAYLNEGFGPLLKQVGEDLQQLVVSPVAGQWYPIVPRADGWTPVGILAPVGVAGDSMHTFRLELGASSGGGITPIPGSLTQPVHVHADTTAPDVSATIQWRHPDISLAFQSLSLADCPVVNRNGTQRVQFRFTVTVSANHLRDYVIGVAGCGPGATPQLITDGRNGLPVQSVNAQSHWHMSAADNSATVVLHYELAAGAPAGCYHFNVSAQSRAFDPRTVVALAPGQTPENFWNQAEQAPSYTPRSYSVAVQ
jgi:hypothetical protein